MDNKSSKKKLFLVVGVVQTGSGTLTYPEDFDIIGWSRDQVKAQKRADKENERVGRNSSDPDEEEEDLSDLPLYEVEEIEEI